VHEPGHALAIAASVEIRGKDVRAQVQNLHFGMHI
jgi:hypothetical protein